MPTGPMWSGSTRCSTAQGPSPSPSGVINDLCKLASFHHGQSYLCVATAASVDGYSSSGAVVSRDGAKLNIETHAPLVILADVGVLAAAPKEMTAAGYADLAAKIPAGAEWMIADCSVRSRSFPLRGTSL